MRKKAYKIFIITLLIGCSVLFTSCSAITAQNITSNDLNKGMNGAPAMNGNSRMNPNTNADESFKGGMMDEARTK